MATLNIRVSADTDDCTRGLEEDAFSLSTDYLYCGWGNAANVSQRGCGMRFAGITIPKGSTIDTAYITFTAKASQSGTVVNTRITGEDTDNAATFSNKADFDTRYAAHTTAVVDWDGLAAWTLDTEYQGPEIKTVIQEIIDRASWASGNAMVLFWQDFDDRSTAQAATRQGYSHNADPNKAPLLHIEYTPPAGRSRALIIG